MVFYVKNLTTMREKNRTSKFMSCNPLIMCILFNCLINPLFLFCCYATHNHIIPFQYQVLSKWYQMSLFRTAAIKMTSIDFFYPISTNIILNVKRKPLLLSNFFHFPYEFYFYQRISLLLINVIEDITEFIVP